MAQVILNPKFNSVLDNPDFYYGDVDPSRTDWIDRYSLPALINGEEPYTLHRIYDKAIELRFNWTPYLTSRPASSIFAGLPNANIAEIREVQHIKGENLSSTDRGDWLIFEVTLITQWRLPNNDATLESYHLAAYRTNSPNTPLPSESFYNRNDAVFFAGDDFINGYFGNDYILGYTGNDWLNGNPGDDFLTGGPGNDLLDGGSGRDTAVFNIASTSVTKFVRHPDETGYIIESPEGIDNLTSIEVFKFTDLEIEADTAFQQFATPPTTYTNSISDVQSVGITRDGLVLVIKMNGVLSLVLRGESLVFTDRSLSTEDLIAIKEDVPVFLSSGDSSGYALGEIFTGPASLGLHYQLIETADNAVVIGSTVNEFIKVSSTNSSGKAVNGGGGTDVIDGGVGSTFVSGGTDHWRSTFFLDGRAPGTSWSTITDFDLGLDKATIWGWKQGVSRVSTSFADFNSGGAEGYEGLTLHFENLLPDGAVAGQTNANLNSITLTGLTLEDFGASSLAELNTQINNKTSNHFQTGVVSDQFGDHGYLFLS